MLFSFLAAWVISEKTKAPEDTLSQLYEANSKPCMNYWTTDPNFVDSMSFSSAGHETI